MVEFSNLFSLFRPFYCLLLDFFKKNTVCTQRIRVYKQKVSAQNSILIFYIQYNLLSFADTHLLSAHFTNRGKGCVFYTMYLLFIKELCLKKKSRPDCSKSSQSVYYPASRESSSFHTKYLQFIGRFNLK